MVPRSLGFCADARITHQAAMGMAVDIFVMLVGGVDDEHFMIEPQLLQPGDHPEKR